MTALRLLLSSIVGVSVFSPIATPAHAQVPTVSPDGTLSDPAAPPPAPAAPAPSPAPITIDLGGQQQGGQEGGENTDVADLDYGLYHLDDLDLEGDDSVRSNLQGVAPETHVVRSGDTLWDISDMYFSNPWEWPRIWSLNPSISNPHWIYPGDIVRLNRENEPSPTMIVTPEIDGQTATEKLPAANSRRDSSVSLRRMAFVEKEQLEDALTIVGSTDDKELLSTGDSIYLSYPEGKRPKIGSQYSVYHPGTELTTLKEPKKSLGRYVEVIGQLEIVSSKDKKRARGVLTESVRVIERGQLVGEVLKRFTKVSATKNTKSLQGQIVAQFTGDKLIGSGQIVFLDVGSDKGAKAGNTLFAVRRGDALEQYSDSMETTGQNDERFPARALAQLIIVEASKNMSVAMVVSSRVELVVGDLVIMRRDP